MAEQFPVVRSHKGQGKYHLVYATGGPGDGSLYGFYTICGHQLTEDTGSPDADWQEVEISEPIPAEQCCRRCWNRLSIEDIARTPETVFTGQSKENGGK